MPELAHPAGLARRIPHNQCIRRNLLSYHCARANKGVSTNLISTHNSCISAYTRALANNRLPVFILARDSATRINHIREDTRGAQEYIVFAFNARVDTDVVLNLHVVAQLNTWTNNHILSQIAVFTHHTIRHHMGEMPNLSAFSNGTAFVYKRRFMREVFLFH